VSAVDDRPVVELTGWATDSRDDTVIRYAFGNTLASGKLAGAILGTGLWMAWPKPGVPGIDSGTVNGLESAKLAVLTALHKRHGRISVDGVEWVPAGDSNEPNEVKS